MIYYKFLPGAQDGLGFIIQSSAILVQLSFLPPFLGGGGRNFVIQQHQLAHPLSATFLTAFRMAHFKGSAYIGELERGEHNSAKWN